MSGPTKAEYPSRGFLADVREDAAVWAQMWTRSLSWAVYLRLLLLEPGFQLAFAIRLQRGVAQVPVVGRLIRRLLWYATTIWTGADVDPDAEIGAGVYFPHPTGVVIGGACRLGRHVSIQQGVTLGRALAHVPAGPRLGERVFVGAGAKLLGEIVVGDNAVVGANAVVLEDVPSGYSAVGVPARIIPPRNRGTD